MNCDIFLSANKWCLSLLSDLVSISLNSSYWTAIIWMIAVADVDWNRVENNSYCHPRCHLIRISTLLRQCCLYECVWVRERECPCLRERESVHAWERDHVWERVHVREREIVRVRVRVSVCLGVRELKCDGSLRRNQTVIAGQILSLSFFNAANQSSLLTRGKADKHFRHCSQSPPEVLLIKTSPWIGVMKYSVLNIWQPLTSVQSAIGCERKKCRCVCMHG